MAIFTKWNAKILLMLLDVVGIAWAFLAAYSARLFF
jgi:hypothetical protein